MTREMIQLRPEVEELVREIATRRDSVLLRVPRGRAIRTLQEDRPVASPSSSFLSRAERHLLQVHREEVAYVLRLAAWHLVTTSEQGRLLVNPNQAPGVVIPIPTARAVGVETSDVLRTSPADGRSIEALEMLVHCVGSVPSRWPSPVQLCVAAHRLVPTFNGRVLAGTAYTLDGHHGVALTVYRDAMRAAPSAQAEGIAWSNVAGLAEAGNAWGTAHDAAIESLQKYPSLIPAHVCRLWSSIRLGDSRGADRSAGELEPILQSAPAATEDHVRRFRANARQLLKGMNSAHLQCLHDARDRAGALAGRILYALD